MKTWWKNLTGLAKACVIAGVILVLVVAAALNPDEDTTPSASAPEPSPTAETTTEAATVEEEETEAPTTAERIGTADELEDYLLAQLGLESFTEAAPDSWATYVGGLEVDGSLVRVTMLTDRTSPAPATVGASDAILRLLRCPYTGIDWVELVNGAGEHIEQTSTMGLPPAPAGCEDYGSDG